MTRRMVPTVGRKPIPDADASIVETVRGARNIAKVLNMTERAIYWQFEQHKPTDIAGLKKQGGTIVLHLPTYRASFQSAA